MIEEINRMVHTQLKDQVGQSRSCVLYRYCIVKEGSISIPLETSDLLDQYKYSFTL